MDDILFQDEAGNESGDPRMTLLAFATFPNSARDRQQVIFIHESEMIAQHKEGVDGNPLGPVARSAIRTIEDRRSRVAMCGFVALALIWLVKNNERASILSASKIASNLAYQHKTVSYNRWYNGKPEAVVKTLSADISDVQTIFREYRRSAHIIVGQIVGNAPRRKGFCGP